MKLNLHTDYSLRTLLYLAANPQRRITLRELSDFYDISIEHLRKVIHALGKLGYINTFRGSNGGFELCRTPEEINIGAVITEMEPRGAVIDCYSQPCRIAGQCQLTRALKEAEHAFFKALSKYSLADVSGNPDLIKVLRVDE